MKIGVAGCGFVGSAIYNGIEKLSPGKHQFIKYDPYLFKDSKINDLKECDMVFICVPTPMNTDGKMDDVCLRDVFDNLLKIKYDGICIIKSTTTPVVVRKLINDYKNLKIVTNPEFLTERTALIDFINSKWIIIGGDKHNSEILYNFFIELWPNAKYSLIAADEAMMVKYMCNTWFSVKVSLMNEYYDLVKLLGMDWNNIVSAYATDDRVGPTHLQVPGPDGDRGFGGKCVTPDTIIDTPMFSITAAECREGIIILDNNGETVITKVGSRMSDVIEIKTRGRKFVATPDHIHMVFDPNKNKIIQKELKDVSLNDWAIIPKPRPALRSVVCLGEKPSKRIKFWINKFSITNDFAWLIGIWLAEGCAIWEPKPELIWTVGEHERFLADKIKSILSNIGINSSVTLQVNKNATYGESRCWRIRTRSTWLNKIFIELGCFGTSKHKRAPFLEKELGINLVAGWLDGDGNLYNTVLSGTSVSHNLIHDIDRLLLQYGICASIKNGCNNSLTIDICRKDWIKIICKYTHRIKPKYEYKEKFLPKSNRSHGLIEYDDFFASKIKSIKDIGKSEVISIETKSHTYNANRLYTHNCFPKDLNALLYLMRENGLQRDVLEAAWSDNEHFRKNKDWLKIKWAII